MRTGQFDGHTRLQAAKLAGIAEIAAVEHEFADEDEAINYAIHSQRARRNLTEAELVSCLRVLDQRKSKSEAGKKGRNIQLGQASNDASPSQPAQERKTATKVERTRRVVDQAKLICRFA